MFKKKNQIEYYEADDYYYYENQEMNNRKPFFSNIETKENKKQLFLYIFLGVYLLFLVIGILATPFYNNNGSKEALILNVNQRESRNDYEKIKNLYVQSINILENIKKTEETPGIDKFTVSGEYQKYLEQIDKLITDRNSMIISKQNEYIYKAVKENIYEVYNNTALYLQNMQKYHLEGQQIVRDTALSQKNEAIKYLNITHKLIYDFGKGLKINDDLFVTPYPQVKY